MNTEVVPKHEKRWLRYDFSAVEVHDLSMEMANKTQEISQVEAEKKSLTSGFASRINILKTSVNSLADKVSSGYEMREVQCDVKYHFPRQGQKILTRKDTGAKIEEKMTDQDWNLWNQVQDEEGKPKEVATAPPVETSPAESEVDDDEEEKEGPF
jgi:hypothetical protein